MSPTQRTLALYREKGYSIEIVERWIMGGFVRKDYLGIIDMIAINETDTIGVQSCGQAWSAHVKKITEECADSSRLWLSCPGRRLVLIGWRKMKVKRGGKAVHFVPREREFYLADFSGSDSPSPVSA